ncbi:MAG: PHP domain-containing protein [Candidatus Aminicenantes bacterium]|nr:PHP domain-containing protein [Candidatus Aminicenantes bacterium]
MKNTIDLHLHTLVSDGTCTPMEMLAAAKESGLSKVSFTDHDALGAYRHFGDMFAHAGGLGIELVPGIELDTDYMGKEIHLLGYAFNLDDGPLNRHLDATRELRKERVTLQLAIINRFFGRMVVDPKNVFIENRDTLMKPHLVHAMLEQGLFSDYRAAAYWVSQNAQVAVVVPKLPLADALAMVRNAGGEAVLAHPGYIARETDVRLESMLAELVPLGLSGLEVDYPYLGTSPAFADVASEKAMIEQLRRLARRFKLKATFLWQPCRCLPAGPGPGCADGSGRRRRVRSRPA